MKIKKLLPKIVLSILFQNLGKIIASIQAAECPETIPLTNKQLCPFTLLSLSDLKKLLTNSTTSKSMLDWIPTRIVKSFPKELLSVVLNLINFFSGEGNSPSGS